MIIGVIDASKLNDFVIEARINEYIIAQFAHKSTFEREVCLNAIGLLRENVTPVSA